MKKQVLAALTQLNTALSQPLGKSQSYTEGMAAALGIDATDSSTTTTKPTSARKTNGRKSSREPAPRSNEKAFNPFKLYAKNPDSLRRKLDKTTVAAMHDLIKEYVLDIGGKTKRWATASKLTDFILAMVASRATKGDVYRSND